MFEFIFMGLLIASILFPIMFYYLGERKGKRLKYALLINLFSFFSIFVFGSLLMFSGSITAAEIIPAGTDFADPSSMAMDTAQMLQAASPNTGMGLLAAALAVGISGIGAGIAVGPSASAAIGALSENESIMGKALIFVALGEGIALYGLVIAFMILGRV